MFFFGKYRTILSLSWWNLYKFFSLHLVSMCLFLTFILMCFSFFYDKLGFLYIQNLLTFVWFDFKKLLVFKQKTYFNRIPNVIENSNISNLNKLDNNILKSNQKKQDRCPYFNNILNIRNITNKFLKTKSPILKLQIFRHTLIKS